MLAATLCEILIDATGGYDKMTKHQEDIYESVRQLKDPINRAKFQQFCNVHRSTFYLLFGVRIRAKFAFEGVVLLLFTLTD